MRKILNRVKSWFEKKISNFMIKILDEYIGKHDDGYNDYDEEYDESDESSFASFMKRGFSESNNNVTMNRDEIISLTYKEFKMFSKMMFITEVRVTMKEWQAFVDGIYDNLRELAEETDFYRMISTIYSEILRIIVSKKTNIGDCCKDITFEDLLDNLENGLNSLTMWYIDEDFTEQEIEAIKKSIIAYSKYCQIFDFNDYYEIENTDQAVLSSGGYCKVYDFNNYYGKRK